MKNELSSHSRPDIGNQIVSITFYMRFLNNVIAFTLSQIIFVINNLIWFLIRFFGQQ